MSEAAGTLVLASPMAGWFGPLEEVPDPVFADRMMGDGAAIDPTEGTLHAPAAGTVIALPQTAHAVTLRLDNGAELLIHIGLETVALKGSGFVPKVAEGDRVTAGQLLISFDLSVVAEAATALITPMVVANTGYEIVLDRPGREVAVGDVVARLIATDSDTDADAEDTAQAGPMVTRDVAIPAPHGIHARPAARIGALLKAFAADVAIRRGDRRANARSTVALLGLGVCNGDRATIEAQGPDAEAAVAALYDFIERGMGDDMSASPSPPLAAEAAGPLCASPGLAIGRVLQLRTVDRSVPEDGHGVAGEEAALDAALDAVASDLSTGGLSPDIAEAHRALLADPELRTDARTAIAEGRSAAFAWRHACSAAREAIRATGDRLLAERVADITDLERQVIEHLLGAEDASLPTIEPGTILVAQDVLPSQFQALDRDRLAGICTAAGGPTAHVAILAAAAGVPMMVAAGPEVLDIVDGTTVILDADAAHMAVDPDVASLDAASARLAERQERQKAERRAAAEDGRLADGTRIEVFVNCGSAEDAARGVAAGAEGCGLLRTEFLFLDRASPPDEAEQSALYGRIAATLGTRPLIVRTLDIGGDKPVPYLPMPAEDNPALGLRGIRLSLARPDMLENQFRAILGAVPAEQCHIMLPMIVDLAEYRAARAVLDRACDALGCDPVPLGVMIETPAAAMLAETLAREAAFLSVGTNDLTQYALACDRGNARVSGKLDSLHPAVLRLIREVGRGAAAHGRWAGVCGGLASDPLAVPILVGLGITELSATPAAIPAIKAALRRYRMPDCERLAQAACDAESPEAVRALVLESQS